MSSAARTYLTPEQYLALERKSDTKHEYDRGRIIAMAGASREHNLIVLNLGSELRNLLRDRECEAYTGDMRVRVEAGLYVYPDVAVACGEPRFEGGEVDTLLNPTLIVEVLSPSTERRDRGRKFHQYRTIESLQQYVMVAQDEVRVECYTRRQAEWAFVEIDQMDATLRLESIGCEVSVREIYAKVKFPDDRLDDAS
jgi:Uma2 family endonuclease